VTFKHAAVLVILVTIAGAPVSTLACVAWCAPGGRPASATCHHHMDATATVGANNAADTCARLFAESPYVKEEIQLTARAATPASAPPASSIIAAGEAQPACVRDVVAAVRHRSTPALVLRL
jgi:hypothetical protein